MQNFIIKTHQKGTVYPQPHLFILNKGSNSEMEQSGIHQYKKNNINALVQAQ
jgi:hypothetical protein